MRLRDLFAARHILEALFALYAVLDEVLDSEERARLRAAVDDLFDVDGLVDFIGDLATLAEELNKALTEEELSRVRTAWDKVLDAIGTVF